MPDCYYQNDTASQEASSYALQSHIDSGIVLLSEGKGLSAYKHFQSSYKVPGLDGIDVGIGMVFPVTRLLSEIDVVYAASTVASHSCARERSAEIGGWHTGDWTTDFSDAAKYMPDMVQMFHQEVGMVAAEEWLHILQAATGAPIAEQEDKEVDVAAYFALKGLDLSADFLTRYSTRANWCLKRYPERRDELRNFCKQFGRIALNSSEVE